MLHVMPDAPAVTCAACNYAWRSATMAEGLRLLGSCPRCSGELRFRDAAPAAPPAADEPLVVAEAPHKVLGVPRR
jgi:hypothetical protein